MKLSHVTRAVLALATVATLAAAAPARAADAVDFRAWNGGVGSAPTLNAGGTLSATQGLLKSNYSDNPGLMNSAWAHAGGTPWFVFQLASTGDVDIDLTPTVAGASFNPGITVWASGASKFDGGTESAETGNNGWDTPHSFNATGQIGDFGTNWMSGANGNMLQTLAYAITGPAHTNSAANGWEEVMKTGVNDISVDDSFEHGVTGTASGNAIHLAFNDLAAGWYTIFIGGTNNALTSASYNLQVAAPVPEPSAIVMMLAGLGLVGLRRRRRDA